MNRKDLINISIDFFNTFYYKSKQTISANALLFTRPTGMGINDELLVYFHQKGEEDYLENNLKILNTEYKFIDNNRRFFLSNVPLGIVPESVTKYNFKYQVPVLFFNREFSSDKKSTPIKSLESEMKKYEDERIEQPFILDKRINNSDILNELINDINNSKDPCIRIIIAPAGYGKTVLMSSLYNSLSKIFKESKAKQKMFAQPLIMLPGHIKRANDIDDLINNFVGDEYDYGIASSDTFKFWINNGFAIWLLDGLEELILKIPEEFIYKLLDNFVYSSQSVNSQIIISIRKPLLAASQEFKEILNNWTGSGLKVYELNEWTNNEKIKYFKKNLSEEDNNFLSDIKNTNNYLSVICKIPYYCSLIATLKNNNELSYLNDEVDLVKYSFEKLCEREFGKGLDKDIFPIDKQVDIFTDIAIDSLKKGFITDDNLKEWAELYLPTELNTNDRVEQLSCIQRHAVLSLTGINFDFVHDIMKQYLIGNGISNNLIKNNINNLDYILIEDCSYLEKYIIKNTENINWDTIFYNLNSLDSLKNDDAFAFRNSLKIYLKTNNSDHETRLKGLLNNKNLSGIVFKNLNLSGFGIQNSNLENTSFINCNLQNTDLSECDFKDTYFDNNCKMDNLEISNSMLQSIRLNDKTIYDQKEILSYFFKRTAKSNPKTEPCQAAINLIKIFDKLIKKGKLFKLPKKFIISTKCAGGISADIIIDSSIRKGFIIEDNKSYLKLRHSLYEEVKDFTKNRKLSDGINKILNEICRDTNIGCKHI